MDSVDFLDRVFAFFLIDFYAQFSFLFFSYDCGCFCGVLDHFLLFLFLF